MNLQPYLLNDPTYGHLLPHKATMLLLGLRDDQLRKHRPSLKEGQHWLLIHGEDHIRRIFYTVEGLVLLCDLLGTPKAGELKASVLNTQAPAAGSLVRAQSAALYREPDEVVSLAAYPVQQSGTPDLASRDPMRAIGSAIRTLFQEQQQQNAENSLSAREVAELLKHKDEQHLQQFRAYSDTILQGVRQGSDSAVQAIDRMPSVEMSQEIRVSGRRNDDPMALVLVGCVLCLCAGLGSWLLVRGTLESQQKQPTATATPAQAVNANPIVKCQYRGQLVDCRWNPSTGRYEGV